MRSTTIRLLVALAANVLLAAGCGGSGGEEDTGDTGADGTRGGYYGGGGLGTANGPTAADKLPQLPDQSTKALSTDTWPNR